MPLIAAASTRLASALNRQKPLDGVPFDPAVSAHTPSGRWKLAHYGVMVPGLPEPFRFFNAIIVLGSPTGVPIFRYEPLRETSTTADAAWILTGSGAQPGGFEHYSIERECEVGADDRHLRFADHLTLARSGAAVELSATHGDVSVDMSLELTPSISHFAHLPGRTYDHWAALARYTGSFTRGAETLNLSGLCTYEYARGINVYAPIFQFFTYQILTVDESTQVLMVEILGPAGLVVQQMVYVRTSDGRATRHVRRFRHQVHAYAEERLTTPDGFAMRMPKTFTWSVQDDDGSPLITINGTTNDDFRYGLGAGYAGSYAYTGTFRGESIAGTAYQEWIDRR